MVHRLPEGPRHHETAELQRVPVDVEAKELAPELRTQATERMLSFMRGVLEGLDGYVIFASTGLYLHGRRQGEAALMEPPGDLDVAVADEETLETIFRRLRDLAGITIDHNSITKPFAAEKMRRLAGKALIDVQGTLISYPFEFFLHSRIVPPEVMRKQERIGGLNVLTAEGLKQQYQRSFEFESRIDISVEAIRTFLIANREALMDDIGGKGDGQLLKTVQEKYGLDTGRLLDLLDLFRRLEATDLPEEQERLRSILASRLAGLKTKTPKRERNIQQLMG